jgi:hypothetical protein
MRNDFEATERQKTVTPKSLASLPFSTSPPYIDKWMELFQSPEKLPKASKSRAFGVNNVLDLAERISFFWHKSYEKNFLAIL